MRVSTRKDCKVKEKIRNTRLLVWALVVMAAMIIAPTVTLMPSAAHAQVEYVKVCSLYGAGFFYLPGTDVCLDVATNEARQETEGGTWSWRVPNNPRTWLRTPQSSCSGGRVVKFGDIDSSGLVENSHSRYETKIHYALKLKPGQYIASVLYRGGFTGVAGSGNFCMYYYDPDNASVAPDNGYIFPSLGCIDTSSQADVDETLMFSPDLPTPPATVKEPNLIGANGDDWRVESAADIQGTLSIWLCLKKAAGPGHRH